MSTDLLVDWLSFTTPSPSLNSVPRSLWLVKCLRAARQATTVDVPIPRDPEAFTEYSGRAPYLVRWTCAEFGTTLLAHPSLGHILVELSGRGCQALREAKLFDAALAGACSRLTRVDLAVDMHCSTDPRAFVKQHDAIRFTASSVFTSRTGITCYVGSQKSDRFARVYRYKEPLPRSDTLRAEHVFRGIWARQVGALIVAKGIAAAAQYCGQVWSWTHADWDVAEFDEEISISRELATKHPNKLLWLLTQVFPAMRKMEKEGIIEDLRSFCDEHLFVEEEVSKYELRRAAGMDEPLVT